MFLPRETPDRGSASTAPGCHVRRRTCAIRHRSGGRLMRPKYMQNVLVGASALLFAGSRFISGPSHDQNGPVLNAAVHFVSAKPVAATTARAGNVVAEVTQRALTAFTG